jgi:hypothetical protein
MNLRYMLAKGLQGGEKQILEEAAESDGMRGENGREVRILKGMSTTLNMM